MASKSKILRSKINEKSALVVPGCHDALSAMIIEAARFEAVQISGFGLAGSWLGKPDVGIMQMQDIMHVRDLECYPGSRHSGDGGCGDATWLGYAEIEIRQYGCRNAL